MKYRLVLLDDQNQEVGAVTTLDIDPSTVIVVMPAPGGYLPEQVGMNIGKALEHQGLTRVVVLSQPAQFVRLEQVDE